MMPKNLSSDFLNYLAETYQEDEDCERLPSLLELSKQLGVSVSSLREQMEVGRALGLIEAKPRTGLRRLPYSFTPAVDQSLSYAITIDQEYFLKFADLRSNLSMRHYEAGHMMYIHEESLAALKRDLAAFNLAAMPE